VSLDPSSEPLAADAAMERINGLLAHAWMVRTFLKHADEIQEDEEMLEVPRMLFDYCRAVEPSRQRGDAQEYVHRARGKLAKLRRVVESFEQNYRRVSDHTNYQMAALSLRTTYDAIEAVLARTPRASTPSTAADSSPANE
jgi:hypothetical protein